MPYLFISLLVKQQMTNTNVEKAKRKKLRRQFLA